MITLAWTNPEPPAPSVGTRAPLAPVPPAGPRPARSPRVDLAAAIARHLAGQDGLGDGEFVTLFATGSPSFRS